YAAPELVHGSAPSPRSDLYGLGATLYTLFTGRAPFEGDDPSERLRHQHEGPPPALPLERSGVPEPLSRLVLQLLAPEPAERPRDAHELRRELERIVPAVRRPLAERLAATVMAGRDRELGRIEAVVSRPRAAVAFVVGEAGIGKTALLDAVAVRGTLDGRVTVALGAAHGAGSFARALTQRLVA